MEKLALLATVLAAFLLIANAYGVRTTITTVEIDNADPSSQRSCREQIQHQDLSQCEKYIRHGTRSGSSSSTALIEMPVEENGREGSSMQQCCSQIRELDDECQCPALKHIVGREGQHHGGGQQGEEMRSMVMRAQNIPTYCRLSQRCPWRPSVWY